MNQYAETSMTNKFTRWLFHHKLRTKVTAAACLFVLIAAIISALNIASIYETLKQEKARKTRQLVEVAHSLVQHYYNEQIAGRLSEQSAQQAAITAIANMRYSSTNYFWINDLAEPIPHMVMHPTIPELTGMKLDDPIYNCATSEMPGNGDKIIYTDGKKNIFLAFNNIARQAEHGYVTYDWPKPLPNGGVTSEHYPKLSYVRLFAPWEWVIGSGIYIDDVDNALHRQIALNILAGMLLLLAGSAFVFVIHRALTPLTKAAAELDGIAQGKAVLHPLTVQHQDEVGLLVDSFNRLQALLAEESRALQENRALLLEAQKMALVGHLIFDSHSGQWRSSETLDRMLGITPDYPRDTASLLALCHPEDRSVLEECLQQDPDCQHVSFNSEFRIRRADNGEERWLHGLARQEGSNTGQLFCVLQDITARKHNEEAQGLAASVFSNTREGIIITDATSSILDVNRAFTQITGYERAEVLKQNPRMLKSGIQSAGFYAEMWKTLEEQGHWSGEIWNRRKNGEVFAELMNISVVHDKAGKTRHYVGIFSDITPMKAHQHKLERMAHFDPLTGIPNRALLADRLNQAISLTQRTQTLMAICYLDLDGFKPVNDQFGHKAGDALLIEMARRMGDCIRAGDTVARIGGDEFVILLLGLSGRSECEAALDRLLDEIARPMPFDDINLCVSASIGVTLFPEDKAETEILLRHADRAMYQAKQRGKSQFCIFSPQPVTQADLAQQKK
jgi:diguanylate cyclase (GGDEF)-like protein/PAS domain S-box-containing protein